MKSCPYLTKLLWYSGNNNINKSSYIYWTLLYNTESDWSLSLVPGREIRNSWKFLSDKSVFVTLGRNPGIRHGWLVGGPWLVSWSNQHEGWSCWKDQPWIMNHESYGQWFSQLSLRNCYRARACAKEVREPNSDSRCLQQSQGLFAGHQTRRRGCTCSKDPNSLTAFRQGF